MKSVRALTVIVAVLVLTGPAVAQEGYPLKGTWYGDFGTANQRHDLTVVIDWDGHEATGIVNPGRNQVPIKSVELDITPGVPAPEGENAREGTPPVFNVRFDVDAPNSNTGRVDSYHFEGEIFNPVAGNRRISGTWTCDGQMGTFQIRRL